MKNQHPSNAKRSLAPDSAHEIWAEIGQNSDWRVIQTPLDRVPARLHNLIISQPEGNEIELDWVRFE